jgi:CheY-like chemotaxis protein
VVGATAGAEVLKLARELAPVAVALDVMMPTQDGWEVLQSLKNDPTTRNIPVIICSVLDDPELAYSLGAAAYLHKPVTQADLLSALAALEPGPGE